MYNAANYVQWRLVHIIASATTQQLRDLKFAFNQVISGTTASLSVVYADIDIDLIGFAVSNKYIGNSSVENMFAVLLYGPRKLIRILVYIS